MFFLWKCIFLLQTKIYKEIICNSWFLYSFIEEPLYILTSTWLLSILNAARNILFFPVFSTFLQDFDGKMKTNEHNLPWSQMLDDLKTLQNSWKTFSDSPVFLGCQTSILCRPVVGNKPKNTLFAIFSSFCVKIKQKYQKMWRKHILTSVWSGQHPNAGGNILSTLFLYSCKLNYIFITYL